MAEKATFIIMLHDMQNDTPHELTAFLLQAARNLQQ